MNLPVPQLLYVLCDQREIKFLAFFVSKKKQIAQNGAGSVAIRIPISFLNARLPIMKNNFFIKS